MNIQTAIEQIKSSGFVVTAINGNLNISPASRLSDSQRTFLFHNKQAILAALKPRPLGCLEEKVILAWLAHIGENDQQTINETLERCRDDPDARRYFLNRADEAHL